MNNKTNFDYLTENLGVKVINKEDKKYYIMICYYEYEENGRKMNGKKETFINEHIYNELMQLKMKVGD